MEALTYEDFKADVLARRRAFHLELRDTYNVESEDEPFRRWRDGEPDDYAWHAEWAGFVRRATAAGVRVQRVRLASVPHTDYIRWGLDVAPLTSRREKTSATCPVTWRVTSSCRKMTSGCSMTTC